MIPERQEDVNLDDDGWDIRETFAYYGCAYYMASCLEVGLAHALMFGEFLVQERDKLIASKGHGFDRKQYESDFDAFMQKQFDQTMGSIMRRALTLPNIDEELKIRIEGARKRRNFLAHDYWRERSVAFATPHGRKKMREELASDREMFGNVDRELDRAMQQTRADLGICEEKMKAHQETMMKKMIEGTYEN